MSAALQPPLADETAEIEAAGRDLGITPGDPAYPFLRSLVRFLVGLHRRVERLEVAISGHMAAMNDVAPVLAEKAGPLIAKSIDAAAYRSSQQAAKTVAAERIKSIWLWAGGLSVAALAAIAGAYLIGQRTGRAQFDDQVQEAVGRIQDAAFVAQIVENNPAAVLRRYCSEHATQATDGWVRCSLGEVWVHGPGESKRSAAR